VAESVVTESVVTESVVTESVVAETEEVLSAFFDQTDEARFDRFFADKEEVLGWLSVHADGRRGMRSLIYEETVSDHLATLVVQATETATLLGLEKTKEMIVQGEEGTIVFVPASRFLAHREDTLILFVDGDVVYANVLLRQLEERAKHRL
jgi:predicted regulator of Ras-like GTPase activity (Roadblock/LC7/MglB family)